MMARIGDAMRRRRRGRAGAAAAAGLLALALAAAAGLSGCGEKIAIPEASGLFGVTSYYVDDTFPEEDPVAVAVIKGYLYVLSGSGSLTKRNTDYDLDTFVVDLAAPTALCADDAGERVFVWEQDAGRVSVFNTQGLATEYSQALPEVRRVAGMACSRAGIEAVAGARTFLYLADPDSFVVHRYVYDDFNGFSPYGILSRRFKLNGVEEGDGLRFVHHPRGLARDLSDSLLVCEVDTLRNWVIRFSSVPDYEDITSDPLDQDPWRGLAVRFGPPSCGEEVSGDYTLGKAEECEGEWVPGPSEEPGEFTAPQAVTVDGEGRIYVADTGNDRIQIFHAEGEYDKLLGGPELTPRPTSLAVVDRPKGSTYYGGYIFVVVPDSAFVRKFISSKQRDYERHIEPEE